MNDQSQPPRKSADLPDDVKAELLRRRDAVDAGEPTIPSDQVFAEIERRLRERSKPSPA